MLNEPVLAFAGEAVEQFIPSIVRAVHVEVVLEHSRVGTVTLAKQRQVLGACSSERFADMQAALRLRHMLAHFVENLVTWQVVAEIDAPRGHEFEPMAIVLLFCKHYSGQRHSITAI